jgi:hypothetical protein
MASRDLTSSIAVLASIAPAVQTATAKGTAVDSAGYESVTVIINAGAVAGSGNFTPKLQESDTTTDGDFTDVAAADLVGSFPSQLEASSVVTVGYRGAKRYVRPVLTLNSGTSIAAGAVAVLGNPHHAPTS